MRRSALSLALPLAATALAACTPAPSHTEPLPLPPARARPAGPAAADRPAPPPSEREQAAALAADSKSLLAAVDALKDRMDERPRDYNITLALGNLYYDNERYSDALGFFAEALKIAAPAERRLRELSGARRANAGITVPVPESCRLDRPSEADREAGQRVRSLEAIMQAAQGYDAQGDPSAIGCWEQLRPGLAALYARRGNTWYLQDDVAKARDDHASALELDPAQPEALFFVGALILEAAKGDRALLDEGRQFWLRLLEVAPDHPRAPTVRETLPRIDELFGKRP